jgi:3-hydroxybutyryl-CoA dehydratase
MIHSEKINITKNMVKEYSNLIGDKNPIHVDVDYAKTTIFKKPIAHGMLISSFFSKIISETYPGHGSIYLSQNIKFVKPCYVGEIINVVITLIDTQNNKYNLLTQIFDNDGELLVDGSALILKKE